MLHRMLSVLCNFADGAVGQRTGMIKQLAWVDEVTGRDEDRQLRDAHKQGFMCVGLPSSGQCRQAELWRLVTLLVCYQGCMWLQSTRSTT